MKSFKTTAVTLAFLLIGSFSAFATKPPKTFAEFYKKYQKVEESFSMSLPTILFKWALEEEERELTEGIKHIKLLVLEDLGPHQQNLTVDIKNYFPEKIYHDLMLIQDGNDRITLKFRENDKNNNELIVLIRDEDSLFSLCITGNVDAKDARKLVHSINLRELIEGLPED